MTIDDWLRTARVLDHERLTFQTKHERERMFRRHRVVLQCVGQQLARAELQIVFHTLLRRIPTLMLAIPFDEVPFKHDRLAYGVDELPVSW